MAEALLGLGPPGGGVGAGADGLSGKVPISHLDQMHDQLRQLLEARTQPTRAEHAAVTFDLRGPVQFTITESDTRAHVDVDPALAGATRPSQDGSDGHNNANTDKNNVNTTNDNNDGQVAKVVRANEVVMNQPQDDPSLQRAVAQQVISLVSAADGCSWAVHDVSRGSHGWTLTYHCKDSLAAWKKQNAKNMDKSVIAEYSQKELDPLHRARPAFDCRGSVSVAFSKSSRSISIKYEHTPLHKTVADVAALYRPPPRPAPVNPPTLDRPKKTPRKRKSEAAAGEGTPAGEAGTASKPKKTPKRRKSAAADGEGGESSAQPAKRRKTKSDANADVPTPGGPVVPPEYPGAAPVDSTNQPPQYGPQNVPPVSGAYPGALVGNGAPPETTAEAKAQAAQAAVDSGVHSHVLLNVPPAEATRRRETAIRLLTEANVDPATLSEEQFSIFANQAPDLQKESLTMFVKYGAERLRIVHPTKDSAASSIHSSATPEQAPRNSGGQQQATQPGTHTPGSAPAPAPAAVSASAPTPTPGPGGGQTTNVSNAGNTAASATPAPAAKPRKPRLSRGHCIPCKANKIKCDHKKPSCGQCRDGGIQCEYPLEKPRKSKGANATQPKSAAHVAPDADSEAGRPPEPAPPSRPAPEPAPNAGLPRHDAPSESMHEPVHQLAQDSAHEPPHQPTHQPAHEPPQQPSHPSDTKADHSTEEIETIDYTSNMPVAGMLTPADNSNPDYFGSGSTGLQFPPSVSNDVDPGLQPSSLSYPEPHTTNPEQPPPQSDSSQMTTMRQTNQSNQRSPLGGVQSLSEAEAALGLSAYASSWQTTTSPSAAFGGTEHQASATDGQQMARQQPSRSSSHQVHQAARSAQVSDAQAQTQTQAQHGYGNLEQLSSTAVSQTAAAVQQHQPQHSSTVHGAQAVNSTPPRRSPFQAAAQVGRAKSRTGHTRTPLSDGRRQTPTHHVVQQQSLPSSQTPAIDTSGYSTSTSMGGSTSAYNSYGGGRYSTSGNDQSVGKLGYEPYAAQNVANRRASSNSSVYGHQSSPQQQQQQKPSTANSYTSTASSTANQWSQSPSRSSRTYDTQSTMSTSNSYGGQRQSSQAAQQQNSSAQQLFNLRLDSSAAAAQQASSTSSPYGQQPQSSYSSYSQRQQQQQQQEEQQTQQTQQAKPQQQSQASWYGGFGTGSNSFASANVSSSTSYGAAADTTGSYQTHHQSTHGSLNQSSSHGYGSNDDLYDLLKAGMHTR